MRINQWISKLTPIAVIIGVFSSGSAAASCSTDPLMGSVCVTAAEFCPAPYYMKAEGQYLPISEWQALYSLLGTNFGGDARTNFQLPDMRGRTAVGQGFGPGLRAIALAQRGGEDFIKLTQNSLPPHKHVVGAGVRVNASNVNIDVAVEVPLSTSSGTSHKVPESGATFLNTVGKDNFGDNDEVKIYGSAGTSGAHLVGTGKSEVQLGNNIFVEGEVESTGEGEEFENRQPFVGLTHCIAVNGTYPSRY
ncbi:phage tail protein [Vibrio splendidus]|jgi:microcystin-dependent protein|uniref:phage tail protein n=2 Tax=Vibrio TaxID=662 RepID=UPI000C8475ED|nr:tail fiber protein [Vibrio splendidus]MCQ8866295.1 tail fiber protein [Vibrio splendidus]PMG52799.1 hypothetical protein BCU88_21905 [Vibrio splendidus]PTO54845.1 hypothetical protein CWN82_18055 [Vibrio splendidus]PTO57347.1 hypothetical protein CWN96_23150 [Vibrio splendidus]PTO80954.1 hypothetical protein CWN93_15370 [Vibrio splendidus]